MFFSASSLFFLTCSALFSSVTPRTFFISSLYLAAFCSSSSFTFTTVEKGVSFSSGLRAYKMVGVHKLAESMSGFKLTFDENATSGRISVYGVL